MFPTKKNQEFLSLEGKKYTVDSFFGESGINYDTYLEAHENNKNKNIYVLSSSSRRFEWKSCTLIGNLESKG